MHASIGKRSLTSRLVLLISCVLLAGCGSTPPEGTPLPSTSPSSAVPVQPTASIAGPSPTQRAVGRFAPDEIAAVVTTNLVVRSAPGTGSDSKINSLRLSAPASVYVVDGPVFAEGYEWYLVDPVANGIPEFNGFPEPGWMAAASKNGEAWLGQDSYRCPAPRLVNLFELERQRALACYGSTPLTFEGTFGGCSSGIPPDWWPWKKACSVYRPGFDVDATPPPYPEYVEPAVGIAFSADIGLPEWGVPIRVDGHFDDPAAQSCVDDGPYPSAPPQLVVHKCRMTFVVTRVTVT